MDEERSEGFNEANDQLLGIYIGCKIIKARPMSKDEFTKLIKKEEVSRFEEDAPGYLVIYPDGYKSWSPEHVFEQAYRGISKKEFDMFPF